MNLWSRATVPLACALALAGSPARADVTKAACISANADGQSLRQAHKLGEAREKLRMCSDPKCPSIVAADCTKRLDELEAAQPTMIFEAKDGSGHDLSAVTVTVEGRQIATVLDGSPLPIEPGSHSFTFTAADQPPVTQVFVLREGEKGRREPIVLGTPPPAAAPAPPSPGTAEGVAPAEPPPPSAMSTLKIAGLTVGGAGVVGLIVGGVFGGLTASEASQQKSDCSASASCPNRTTAANDHSSGETDSTVSTVAFVAGGVLAVTGAVLFFMPRRAGQTETTAVRIAPSVSPGGGGLVIQGGF